MAVLDWPRENVWLMAADDDLFPVIRRWARGDLRDVTSAASDGVSRTLLVRTPAPWTSIVAVAQQRGHALRPVLVLKNAIALWSLRQSLADGPVPVESWPPLRRLFLIHNPGLGGILTLLDRAFERDPPR